MHSDMEPVTIVGAIFGWTPGLLLQAVIPNWIAGATQRHIETTPGRLWDAVRTRVGSVPRNHDLLRASRQALASSVLVLVQSLERHWDALPNPERHGIEMLRSAADRLAKDADKDDIPGAAAARFARFDALLLPDEASFVQLATVGRDPAGASSAKSSAALGVFRTRFHDAVGAWLREIIAEESGHGDHSAAPACFDGWLRDGFDYHAPEGSFFRKLFARADPASPLRVTLFDVWSQCFFERLKDGQRAFRAYMLGSVQDLAGQFGEMKALLSDDLAGFRDTTEQHLASFLDSLSTLDWKLTELTGLTASGFAEMRARLDAQGRWLGVMSSLARQDHEQLGRLATEFESFRTVIADIAKGLNEEHQLAFREGPIREQATSVGADVPIRDLYYEYRWLPDLLSRGEESAALRAFLDRPEPFLWWGVVGEAGVGKSRLALELILEARARGWRAGFLEDASDALRLSAANRFDLWKPGHRTLIVIDYASKYRADIPTALAKLRSVAHGYTHPLRILLLDRPGAVKPLFSELGQLGEGHKAADCDHARISCHRQSAPTFGEKEDLLSLEAVPREFWMPFLREVVRRAGITEEAFISEQRRIAEHPEHFITALSRATGGGRPLLLQLFGLGLARQLAAGATEVDYANPLALLDEMLADEIRRRWRARLPAGEKGDELLPHLQRAVAFVTLCRGLDLTTHANDFRKAVGLGDKRDRDLVVALGEILGEERSVAEDGKPHRKLRPFEPDLLAERFILLGGIQPGNAIPGLDECPFSATALVGSAMSLAPGNVGQFIALALDDYPTEAAPLLAAAIPHVPAPTLDFAALPVEAQPFVAAVFGASPIVPLWVAAKSFFRSRTAFETAAIYAAFLEWAHRSDAHRLAGLAGAFGLRAYLSKDDKAWDWLHAGPDAFIRALAPYSADCLPAFSKLLVIGAYEILSDCGDHGRWEDFAAWGETLRGVAEAHPQSVEIQTFLAKGAVNALSKCGKHGRWEDFAA